jgi:hypothetical protein
MIFLKVLEKKHLVKFRQRTQMYVMKMCRLHQAQIGPSWNPLQIDYISTCCSRPYELCARGSAVDVKYITTWDVAEIFTLCIHFRAFIHSDWSCSLVHHHSSNFCVFWCMHKIASWVL